MQTSLRKIGNSTGLIVPSALLKEIGLVVGATIDMRIENGRLIAVPVAPSVRAGWAKAAAALSDEPIDADWEGFGNEDDAALTW